MKSRMVKTLVALPVAAMASFTAYHWLSGPESTDVVSESQLREAPGSQVHPAVKNAQDGASGPATDTGDLEYSGTAKGTRQQASVWHSSGADPSKIAAWRKKVDAKREKNILSKEPGYQNVEQMAEVASRSFTRRLGLTDEQSNQASRVYQQYAEQLSTLENFDGTTRDLSVARRRIEVQRMQDLAPIWRESPALQTAMARFMEAGENAGGTLVAPTQGPKVKQQ